MLAASPTHSIPRNCSTWLILSVVCISAFITSACGEGSSGPPSIDSDNPMNSTAGTNNTSGQMGGFDGRLNNAGEATSPTGGIDIGQIGGTTGGTSTAQNPGQGQGGDINQSTDMGLENDQGIDEPDASMDGPTCIPAAEICDGVDNDCDDKIDEEFDFMTNGMHCGSCNQSCQPNNATGRCEAGQCVIGQCSAGFVDANAASEDGCECALQNGGNEACNGVDDDCDGRIDESFDLQADPMNCGQCGVVCAFNQAMAGCQAGQCVLVACNAGFGNANEAVEDGCECTQQNGGIEVCNQVDDDCDGQPDEGFDLARDPNHCGACGVVCTVNNGQASCVNSECAVGSCNNGYVDLNEEAADGCECAQTNNGVEACNGSDDDCDGNIDEGFDVGVACSAGVGACVENGQKECTADGQGTECNVDGAPRGVETCNNIDDDCDGRKDEGFDGDDDGFKTCINGIDCTQPCPAGQDCAGCALSDCNDGLANINPNTPEICGDNVDQNCDGRDAPCIVPAARMSRLAFVSNQNLAKCADMNGDGQPDNILTRSVPAGIINALIGPAFQEGSANSVNLMFLFYGVQNSNVDANFELATVNASRSANRYDVLQASIDANTGRPVNEFPGTRLQNANFIGGPREFVLRLPLGGGAEVALNTREAIVRGRATIPTERNGRVGALVREGILTAAIEKEQLIDALTSANQGFIAGIFRNVQPDLDKDGQPGNESFSLCLEFDADPPQFELFGIPPAN